MNDEQWIAWGGLDDDAWYAAVQRDIGFDAAMVTPVATEQVASASL